MAGPFVETGKISEARPVGVWGWGGGQCGHFIYSLTRSFIHLSVVNLFIYLERHGESGRGRGTDREREFPAGSTFSAKGARSHSPGFMT